ncbi:coat F domain-containing protein [Melghirimyces profundicolus]|uniref:Coat F domain-containing protein n=1 Tax=Melghirimyces profundicolus TaxID=1242148 RepID=A0A2T6BGK1_9BACL|nr:spore coat protein [Melghirimyces profundicolus]PTX55180.1 coat F domain-containing protein [Melghirimyces profundicolus]
MGLLEREMAQDMLMMEKQLTQSYSHTESYCANRALREAMHRMHTETEELHTRLFNTMHQKGWVQTPVAGQQEIESAILHWEQQALKQPELGGDKHQKDRR